jgi:hypothetical protein
MESLNKVVFAYLRQMNSFYSTQRRVFTNIRSIDSDGYIQTAELNNRVEKVQRAGGDAHLAKLEYWAQEQAEQQYHENH